MISRTLAAGVVFVVVGGAAAVSLALLDGPVRPPEEPARAVSALGSNHCSPDEEILNRTAVFVGGPLTLRPAPDGVAPDRTVRAASVEPLCRNGLYVKVIGHAADGRSVRGWASVAVLSGDDGLVTGSLPGDGRGGVGDGVLRR